MKQPTTVVRALLVASLESALVGGTLDALIPGLIPRSLREAQAALDTPEFTARELGLLVFFVAYTAAFLVCVVALFRFRHWAPRATLYLTIASVALYPFLGTGVASEWSQLFVDASGILWGAVLAMAHLPPMKERFASIPSSPGVPASPATGHG